MHKQSKQSDLQDRSYKFSLEIVKLAKDLDNSVVAQVIVRQLLRSGTSIGANIAEAQAGSSKKDFTNFFNHALKSANETKFWLKLLGDTIKVNNQKIDDVKREVTELANILGSSIITLRSKQ